ncbi:MAG: hypothetical protein FWG97_01615 [Deltaproteobacteria bacterium]|nr:hypothetical protein [Deltaproteobacteria bacterium]
MKKIFIVILGFALGWTLGMAASAEATENPEDPSKTATLREEPSPPQAPASPLAARIPAAPRYQYLRPGQAADPGLALPPPPVPFDIRRQKTDGHWLGVTERELADGHLVEVHVSGSARLLGQEVISRPTGHKVYRYYIGDAPTSPSTDPGVQ